MIHNAKVEIRMSIMDLDYQGN